MDELLLIVAFAVVLAGALLFTNAVEWLGHRLGLGEGAVGSVLAAVGTAAPETLIAIVALLSTNPESEDVAIGAIVGAPFLLGTLAMGLVGLFAYLYRGRRRQGVNLDAHAPTLERDLIFFLAFFGIAGALAWGPPAPVRIVAGAVFLLAHGVLRPPPPRLQRRRAGRGDAEPADLRPPRRRALRPAVLAHRRAAARRPR